VKKFILFFKEETVREERKSTHMSKIDKKTYH